MEVAVQVSGARRRTQSLVASLLRRVNERHTSSLYLWIAAVLAGLLISGIKARTFIRREAASGADPGPRLLRCRTRRQRLASIAPMQTERASGLPDSGGARPHAMFHVMLPGRLPGFLRETVNRA